MAKKILISDTTKVTHDEWLEQRKKGIGGSDAAAVLGISPWKTPYQLYMEKRGETEQEISQKDSVPLRAGSVLENLIVKLAERLTGAKIVPAHEMVCLKDRPYITANPDAFMYRSDGTKALVEIKTLNRRMVGEKWGSDTIPPYYESQLRQYQGVYDTECIDTSYFFALPIDEEERALAAMFGNSNYEFSDDDIDLAEEIFASRLITRTIERDRDYEESLFELETTFWTENVVCGELPKVSGSDKELLAKGAMDDSPLMLDGDENQHLIDRYDTLCEQKKAINNSLKTVDEQIEDVLATLIEHMDGHKIATIGDRQISVKKGISRTGINADNLKKLKLKYPKVYDEFVKTTVGKNRVAIGKILK